MRGSRGTTLAAAIVIACGTTITGAAAPAFADGHHHDRGHHRGLFVSPSGTSGNGGWGCDSATFSTVGAAVAAAPAGSTVTVCRGTYAEDVVVSKSLRLLGRDATIDATGLENAIKVVASSVRVSGFTLKNAQGEGILVGADTPADGAMLPAGSPVLSHVLLSHLRVVNNDKGFNGTENGACDYPGDCGGGIHLQVTAWSAIVDSYVAGNADGILVTDDYGPASHNLIAHNYVSDNTTECGIVLPSHNSGAVSYDPTTMAVTGRNPTVGGVFDNLIIGNVANRNGTVKAPPQFGGGGSGSGIGIFGSGPGSGAYDNLIIGNQMTGNGLAGFTIHAHLPGGEDVNGNNVLYNRFGTNNVGGDGFDGPPGPTDFVTTAIAVYSAPTATMTIRGNHIRHNVIGIWLSSTVTAHGLHHNHFHNVTHHVVIG